MAVAATRLVDKKARQTIRTPETPLTPETVYLANFGGMREGVPGIHQPNFNFLILSHLLGGLGGLV
jgi:hypothetical protein